jgi:hypothetical protein
MFLKYLRQACLQGERTGDTMYKSERPLGKVLVLTSVSLLPLIAAIGWMLFHLNVARVGRSLPALHLGLLQPDAEIKLLMGFVIGTLMGPLILRVGARCARGHKRKGCYLLLVTLATVTFVIAYLGPFSYKYLSPTWSVEWLPFSLLFLSGLGTGQTLYLLWSLLFKLPEDSQQPSRF